MCKAAIAASSTLIPVRYSSVSTAARTRRPFVVVVDFARLHALQQAGAFFVTRAKSPMDARRVYSAPTDRSTGIISDQQVMLNGHYSAKKYPQHLRRIRFKDPHSGKTLIFLTNHMALPALTSSTRRSAWPACR